MKHLRNTLWGLTATLALGFSASAAEQAARLVTLDIASQPLADALSEMAKQSGLQIVFLSELGKGMTAGPLAGRFTPEQALERLLLNTGLEYSYLKEDTVAIRSAKSISDAQVGEADERLRVAQAEGSVATSAQENAPPSANLEQLDEVVVTGTHIRGAHPVGSQVIVYDREDIARTGVGTVDQLVRTLPQNFGNADPNTAGPLGLLGEDAGLNGHYGSSVNLHGVGSAATLTLLNGHRIAPSNLYANFSDISLIPLSAMERVEILADGASAIYGSDAIGGVVNFILRKDYQGAETQVRFGSATRGGADETSATQAFGYGWGHGSALLNISYSGQKPYTVGQRDFIDLTPPNTLQKDLQLQPDQHTRSVIGAVTHEFSSGLSAHADAFFSDRSIEAFVRTAGGFSAFSQNIDAASKTVGGALGSSYEISRGWRIEAEAQYSRSRASSESTIVQVGFPQAETFDRAKAQVRAADLRLQGPLWHTRGGNAQLLVGGSTRSERFAAIIAAGFPEDSYRRRVDSAYGELIVDLSRNLKLSAALRHDRYDDFGDTTNPKLGLSFEPVRGLTLRSSWGKSFRAPELPNIANKPIFAFAFSGTDAQGDPGATLLFFGSEANPDLQPETATTFTTGFDVALQRFPGLKFSASYFRIDYQDKIDTPTIGDFAAVLTQPELGRFITLSPQDADAQALIDLASSNGRFFNFTGGPDPAGSDIDAIFDQRLQNIAATETRGVDLQGEYGFDLLTGRAGLSVDATYLIEQNETPTPGIEAVNLLNRPYRPVDLRVRSSLSWSQGGFTAALSGSYVDGYRNILLDPPRRIKSWTTFDLQLSYAIEREAGRGLLDGTTLSLSALNVLDADPPRVRNQSGPATDFRIFGYDPSNASLLGRFLALSVTKQWGGR